MSLDKIGGPRACVCTPSIFVPFLGTKIIAAFAKNAKIIFVPKNGTKMDLRILRCTMAQPISCLALARFSYAKVRLGVCNRRTERPNGERSFFLKRLRWAFAFKILILFVQLNSEPRSKKRICRYD